MTEDSGVTPAASGVNQAAEAKARDVIDRQLEAAGWFVQDRTEINLFANGNADVSGIAVRESIMKSGHGRVDYLLYVNRKVVGVIEAKPMGMPLSGVEWQSAMYATGLPENARRKALDPEGKLPFAFEASGTETHFTNGFDPDPRSRRIFSFPRPVTLNDIVRAAKEDETAPTWRGKVRYLPELDETGLRPAQIDAVKGIEQSLKDQRFSRSLVQMATGAGKTYTAVTEAFRLLKWGGFKRVLFLVDRNNLAEQAIGEFQNYQVPDDGRRFTELYNVAKLGRGGMPESTNVAISTIQRVFAALRNEEVPEGDDPGLDGYVPEEAPTVSYSADLPPETFDLVIVDEAHRSIYGVWRGVLEYFDAHIVGLTATPGKQTFGFFQQNLVSEYTYQQSVADGVNVDFDIYRIKTDITANGSSIDAGTYVPTVNRTTREQKLVKLDEDLTYTPGQLDRAVTAKSQIRLVLETFRDKLFTEIFPGRHSVPKTLIFAKDDNHAEEIVQQVREVFGKGNDFAAKITYSTKDPKGHLQKFRNSTTLRIAVTVDMIATGTDVKPLECVMFMRDVRSGQYFEQMKGRGARTIASADFRAVTDDAEVKTRFVVVDAVGVTEHDFVEPPLNRDKSISLKKLLDKAATLNLTEDETATLASRLAALDRQLTPEERTELDEVAEAGPDPMTLHAVVRKLVNAVDPQVQAEAIAANPDRDPAAVIEELVEQAVEPLAANPELRTRIIELRRLKDQMIDEVSVDVLDEAYGVQRTDRAEEIVTSWREYLSENRNEISAIQLMFDAKAQGRGISYGQIEELKERIARPPHNWTVDVIWNAYISLHYEYRGRPENRDRHAATDLISLLRLEAGVDDALTPYAEQVEARYMNWLQRQEQAGVTFTETQRWWLDKMMQIIASSAGLDVNDLDNAPFDERGGVDGVLRDLGDGAGDLIDELNRELSA